MKTMTAMKKTMPADEAMKAMQAMIDEEGIDIVHDVGTGGGMQQMFVHLKKVGPAKKPMWILVEARAHFEHGWHLLNFDNGRWEDLAAEEAAAMKHRKAMKAATEDVKAMKAAAEEAPAMKHRKAMKAMKAAMKHRKAMKAMKKR